MIKYYFFLNIIIIGFIGSAKENNDVHVNIIPMWGKEKLKLNNGYLNDQNNKFLIKTLKFYITKIELLNDSKTVYSDKSYGHLINIKEKSSFNIILKKAYKKPFNSIRFNFGVDSLTNSQGALGQDLDPTKGMYWSWQSGYINFKLEGERTIGSDHKEFIYHLGGYKSGFNSVAQRTISVSHHRDINIYFDIALFFSKLRIEIIKIMSPSKQSVKLMALASKCFYYEG